MAVATSIHRIAGSKLFGGFASRLASSPLRRRFIGGAFWALANSLVIRGGGLVTSVVMARILGKREFGELGMINSTLAMFYLVAGFGLGSTATKYIAELKRSDPARAGRVLTLSTIVAWSSGAISAAILLMLSFPLAVHSLANSELASSLRICAPLVLLGAVVGGQQGALSGFELFRPLAGLALAAFCISLPLQAIGALRWGLEGSLWGLVVGQSISSFLYHCIISRTLKKHGWAKHSSDWGREWRVLVGYSLPAVLSSFVVLCTMWICAATLVRQPGGYVQMASFSAANQWRFAVTFLPALIASVYFPIVASLPKNAKLKKMVMKGVGVNLLAGAGLCIILFPLREPILGLYGPDFAGGALALGLLLCAGILESANEVLLRTLLAFDRGWLRLISNGAWALTMLVLTWRLVPQHGAVGLAWAILLALCCHLALQWAMVYLCLRNLED